MVDKACPIHPEQLVAPGLACLSCDANLPPTAYKNPPLEGGFLKRPLVEITRTKKIETALGLIEKDLERIATALEQFLIEEHGYHTEVPTVDTSGPEPQVEYTDQDRFDIEEMIEEVEEK